MSKQGYYRLLKALGNSSKWLDFQIFLCKFTDPFTIFFQSCKRMIDWFPVIWKDRDWDHAFFTELLEYKLRRMEKALTHTLPYARPTKTVQRIKVCRGYLQRMNRHNYTDADWKWIDQTFGERTIDDILYNRQDENDPKVKLRNWYVRKACLKEDAMWQSDLNEALRIMAKYLGRWWD